jgi:predicted PolB exonuclease-like 3'-5' exonuclease
MPRKTLEQRREYEKGYRIIHRDKWRKYQREYKQRKSAERKALLVVVDRCDSVLKSIPNPFGSFEKAQYVIYKPDNTVLYSFVTTCRNTEDCIEIMKEKYLCLFSNRREFQKYCSIYKIQKGIKKLIFRDVA